VKDGLSHTMLVAGVESQLGSWARPGHATMRSFTREPYLHGPDGFGTGQPDEMLVLMADGSVRRISGNADPVVTRRMAAMADGTALDSSVAGDPQTMGTAPAAAPSIDRASQEEPIFVEMAVDVPEFDFRPRLQQKIASFEVSQPTEFKVLIYDLQELIGAPMDLSKVEQENLDRLILMSVREGTVEEILNRLCDQAGVVYTLGAGRISFGSRTNP